MSLRGRNIMMAARVRLSSGIASVKAGDRPCDTECFYSNSSNRRIRNQLWVLPRQRLIASYEACTRVLCLCLFSLFCIVFCSVLFHSILFFWVRLASPLVFLSHIYLFFLFCSFCISLDPLAHRLVCWLVYVPFFVFKTPGIA